MKYSVLMVLIFIAGCGASIVYSSKGEELYYSKCGGCHRVYPKSDYNGERWRSEMETMSIKAKLSADEKRMIIEYLVSK